MKEDGCYSPGLSSLPLLRIFIMSEKGKDGAVYQVYCKPSLQDSNIIWHFSSDATQDGVLLLKGEPYGLV